MERGMFLKYLRLICFLVGLAGSVSQSWAYNIKNGSIYGGNGNQISIDGIAWIGFQDSNFLGGHLECSLQPN